MTATRWGLLLAVITIGSSLISFHEAFGQEGKTHDVLLGETLHRIARNYGVTVKAIQEANGITDPSKLQAGKVLKIPGGQPSEEAEVLSPEATVAKIYREHIAGRGPLNDVEQRKFWPFYFSGKLVKILDRGNWGADPFLFAQDYQVTGLKTSTISNDGKGRALVLVKFNNFEQPTELVVSLRNTDHGWTIGNITDPTEGTDLLHDWGS